MARPKIYKKPVTLNLLLENKTKQRAYKLSGKRGLTMSRLFESLVEAEFQRLEQEAA